METILFAVLGLAVGVLINWLSDVLPPEQARAPFRIPLVLLVSALGFAILPTRFGGIPLLLATFYTFVFLLVLVIDFEHRLILNVVILPATLVALAASPLTPAGFGRSLLGGVTAYAFAWLVYILAGGFVRLRGYSFRVPFGFGDVKLAGFVGIVTGFPSVVSALILAILFGGVGALVFLGYQLIVQHRLALRAAIPYGPFFCLAGWAVMVTRVWALFI